MKIQVFDLADPAFRRAMENCPPDHCLHIADIPKGGSYALRDGMLWVADPPDPSFPITIDIGDTVQDPDHQLADQMRREEG